MKISEILSQLEQLAPSGTAEASDNVGLLVGDPSKKTSKAVVSIDLTEDVVKRARQTGAGLIVTHHPCIFPRSRGLSRLVSAGPEEKSTLIFDCIRSGIAIAACHTNFDRCSLEVVERVAKGLGLTPKGRLLDPSEETPLLKLVVFVPLSHLDVVREALSQAGAGRIGNYDFCTFQTSGEGTFRGLEGTRPFVGRKGQIERVKEARLETILPAGLKAHVLKALFASHPYEEVAYDLYPTIQNPQSEGVVKGLGYGFWGDFPRSKSFPEVARRAKRLFKLDGYLLSGPSRGRFPKQIKRVAFAAGKGASFASHAQAMGCDLFITGEAGYHTALDGARRGMVVMELGHTESEYFFPEVMGKWLSQMGLKTTIRRR